MLDEDERREDVKGAARGMIRRTSKRDGDGTCTRAGKGERWIEGKTTRQGEPATVIFKEWGCFATGGNRTIFLSLVAMDENGHRSRVIEETCERKDRPGGVGKRLTISRKYKVKRTPSTFQILGRGWMKLLSDKEITINGFSNF